MSLEDLGREDKGQQDGNPGGNRALCTRLVLEGYSLTYSGLSSLNMAKPQ